MKHLEEANETYLRHLGFTLKVAFILVVHGFIPCIWESKASELMATKHTQ